MAAPTDDLPDPRRQASRDDAAVERQLEAQIRRLEDMVQQLIELAVTARAEGRTEDHTRLDAQQRDLRAALAEHERRLAHLRRERDLEHDQDDEGPTITGRGTEEVHIEGDPELRGQETRSARP